MRALVFAALICAPAAAMADTGQILQGVGMVLSLTGVASWAGYALMAAGAAYGAADARRQARRAQAQARDTYNAGLSDRTATILTATPAWRYIYGRCWVGGDIVAELTTDKYTTSDTGASITKPDALKHLVIELAHHEVHAIHGMRINGIDLGEVSASGWATGGPTDAPWGRAQRMVITSAAPMTFDANGRCTVTHSSGATLSKVLAANVLPLSSIEWDPDSRGYTGTPYTLSVYSPTQIAGGPPGGQLYVSYELERVDSAVRWSWHTGAPGQTADAYLMSVAPTQWTSAHIGTGRAYVVVTLDLEDQRFQSGPPQLHWEVSGRKVLDPRTSTTAWSDNPALCIYDWLRAKWGYDMDAADIDTAAVSAAATACDQSITLTQGATSTTGKLYTLNGGSNTGASKEAVLEEMANAMAGAVHYGATWTMHAGVWTATVMDMTDDDLAGPIQIVQAGIGIDDAINSLRCTYITSDSTTEEDGDACTNSTFVTADGEELWGDVALAWTNSKPRCRNLQRIRVEQARMGLVVSYPAKMRAWPLQVGDRVRVTSAEYGWSLKTFRVTDWGFGLRDAVQLTLQEDVASVWDLADAATADPAPNTSLANPWAISQPAGLTCASGTAHLLPQSDGTISPRVYVSWTQSGAARTDVEWMPLGVTGAPWTRASAYGENSVYLSGMRDAQWLAVRARHVNSLGIESAWVAVSHAVIGKREAPTDVTGVAVRVVPGALVLSWDHCTDLDYAETEIRVGASWAAGQLLFVGRQDEWSWPWPALGSYTLWLKHRDTTGNISTSSATMTVTITATEAQVGMDVVWDDGLGNSTTWDDGLGNDANWGSASAVSYLVDTEQVAVGAIDTTRLEPGATVDIGHISQAGPWTADGDILTFVVTPSVDCTLKLTLHIDGRVVTVYNPAT